MLVGEALWRGELDVTCSALSTEAALSSEESAFPCSLLSIHLEPEVVVTGARWNDGPCGRGRQQSLNFWQSAFPLSDSLRES